MSGWGAEALFAPLYVDNCTDGQASLEMLDRGNTRETYLQVVKATPHQR